MTAPMLTLLGLGPGDPALLTQAAVAHLASIDELVLRTAIHPTVAALPSHVRVMSFDDLYEQAPDFETIYATIAQRLLRRVRAGEAVTYAVPGHPLVAEATTRHLLAAARAEGLPTRIIAGVSFIEPVCEALALDPFSHGLQLLDALDLRPPSDAPWNGDNAWIHQHGGDHYEPPVVPFPLVPTRPALLSQMYNRRVASDAKLTLLHRYPSTHPVTLVSAAGMSQASVRVVPLAELDHSDDLDHLTVAFVPALEPINDLRSMEGSAWVIARLLGPGGCPWDREQTHQSLRPFFLEETYEVLETLDAGDTAHLSEEMGDVLLQILLHSEMARQAGDFDFGDVLAGLSAKLIRRHPHVFGQTEVAGSSDVLRNWEAIKREERAGIAEVPKGTLDGLPRDLPALAAAQKLGNKAARTGFNWSASTGVWDKLREELGELEAAPPTERAEELGDVLFVLTRLADWYGIDAEGALREANLKFRRRFAALEREADGQPFGDMPPDELLARWRRTKHA
jgi:tetrapyrrole methylase family protein / MazG family protein